MTFRRLVPCLGLAAVAVAALLATPSSALAQAKSAKLTTLEWPPYTGAALKDGGGTTAVIRAAFEAVGWKVTVEVLPWKRAVAYAHDDPTYAGYFPEYEDPEVAKEFNFSPPVGSSPLGFVERADKPLAWEKVPDLARYKIGTVDGYVNSEEFDKAAAAGKQPIEVAKDDETNIRKVGAGRLDAAIIDRNVLAWELGNTNDLKPLEPKLHFNAKLLADNGLFIAFRKSPTGDEARAAFAEGLKKIDLNGVLRSHFVAELSRPGALVVAGN